MELEKIKELIALMNENDLSEIEIIDGQTRIMLKRGTQQGPPQIVAMPSVLPTTPTGGENTVAQGSPATPKQEQSNLIEIVSPIVGTFFIAPSPSAEHFVEIGTLVEEDSVVCIIEAMKVMNEIKSEVKGTVKEVLVSNGQSVEYGQPLFLVEPS